MTINLQTRSFSLPSHNIKTAKMSAHFHESVYKIIHEQWPEAYAGTCNGCMHSPYSLHKFRFSVPEVVDVAGWRECACSLDCMLKMIRLRVGIPEGKDIAYDTQVITENLRIPIIFHIPHKSSHTQTILVERTLPVSKIREWGFVWDVDVSRLFFVVNGREIDDTKSYDELGVVENSVITICVRK